MTEKRRTTIRNERDISAIMRRVPDSGTNPELAMRRALWKRGFRYHVCPLGIPGKPDVVFASKKLAVFIDGDYWHGNQWRVRRLSSLEEQFADTKSKDYWLRKIRRNMSRDCEVTRALLVSGWTVLRFWESSIKKDLEKCVNMIAEVIEKSTESTANAILPQRTVAEFFAGIGLMRTGLERHGWRVEYANDIDPQKREMYRAHFSDPDDLLTPDDVHQVAASSVPSVTLATASFPCNDLSLAGARDGLKGKSSSAFWGFTGVIEQMGNRKPPMILLENVPGFLTSHDGKDFLDALTALNRLGYSVDTFILDAAWFVPQSRQRLFVVGTLDNLWNDGDDNRISESGVRPKALVSFIRRHPGVSWRIRPLPTPPQLKHSLPDILEELPDTAPEWWNDERTTYLLSQMSPRHRLVADYLIAGPKYSYGTVFRRIRNGKSTAELRTDGIAGCLRTPRGGSGRQILVEAGKGQFRARLLTPRECARLMGADDHTITVSLNHALFGFGDAVCVPVVEWIAQYYLNPVVNELIHTYPLVMAAE